MTQYARTIRTKVVAGDTLVLTEGDYSDYEIDCVVVALKSFDVREVAAIYRREQCDEDGYVKIRGGQQGFGFFASWLLTRAYIAPVDYVEWHFGSYGQIDDADQQSLVRRPA